jgi:predicted amidohydrolase
MIFASAQTTPVQGDIQKNLEDHYRLIKTAAENGAVLIVFPEMSITGYLRAKASRLALNENDPQLNGLRKLSAEHEMIIIAGAPVEHQMSMYIGSFIIFPNGAVSLYTKQFLHAGEERYFRASFEHDPRIEAGGERVSLAICADIDNPSHPENAFENGCTLYIPSIFFSTEGMDDAYTQLRGYAKKYSMNILMSNYCGETWGRTAGGESAFWSKDGNLVASLDGESTGLLIIEKQNDIWLGKTIKDL